MSNKTGPNSQANLLRAQGVPALGSVIDPRASINPIGYYNPDREKYRIIWSNYDFNQCVSRYVWDNLPNGLTSWNLERMLYFRGTLCGFKVGGKVYILPYTATGELNPYGFPVEVTPITFNGRGEVGKNDLFNEDFKLNVDINGDDTDNYSAVLLYDALPYNTSGQSPSRYFMNQIIINEICETFARININVVVSNKKILIECKDAKQAAVIRAELAMAFASDCPFGVITSPLDSNNIQSTSDFNADDLFNTIKNYDAIRCFMNGIASKGFGAEKKERLVTGELAGAEENTDLILDMGYDLRKLFCDLCNKKFGTNMVVKKRSDIYQQEQQDMMRASTEVNGHGLTASEEVEDE